MKNGSDDVGIWGSIDKIYRKLYKRAMIIIPTASVQKRLLVLMATSRVGIKTQIYRLWMLMFMAPSGARMLKAVKPPKTAGATYDSQRFSSAGNS